MEFLGHVGGMGIDAEVSKQFQRLMTKQGIKFRLNTKVTAARRDGDKVRVTVEGAKDGKTEEVRRLLTRGTIEGCYRGAQIRTEGCNTDCSNSVYVVPI